MLNCQNCQHNYFCCKLRVKTTFWERLKIRLKGHKNFIEKDPEGKKLLKFPNGQCYFLESNKCKIYNVRPKPCRDFPGKNNCDEIFKSMMKIRKNNFDSQK